MIGRDMEGWTDVELQRVADATVWSHSHVGCDRYGLWGTCLQGVRHGGDKRAARSCDHRGRRHRARFYRSEIKLVATDESIKLSSRYDELCSQFGRTRIVRMIQDRARRILASRSLSALPKVQETAQAVEGRA